MTSSSSHLQNQESNAFSLIEPVGKRRLVSESSTLYDVFINHRGPDVKGTLATQLYNSLKERGIWAFLDSEEKELGISFPSTIEVAIRSAKVHIAIFSKRYAESPWCLTELVLMRESRAKIIPVFYEVNPWELRYIEKGTYAEAFVKYEEKGRYLEKLNEWKEALQAISFDAGIEIVAGVEYNADCENILAAVQKEVERKEYLHVATHPVGLSNLVKDFEKQCLDKLVQDFENQCGLKEKNPNAMVVGIFGIGGSGKTTLAKELFNRKISDYNGASFLFDVREAYCNNRLPDLQVKLLQDLFRKHDIRITCTEEGISKLKDHFQRIFCPSFLIVVDDIDHVDQLKALLVMEILNNYSNSLVIVTTRDVGVLVRAGITHGYNLKGLESNDGRELFCWHAFSQPQPCSGYEKLVDDFVYVCGGLPLSLQVLGRHVHGRSEAYWRSELTKVTKTLHEDVKQRLKISFDSLDDEQQEVFMDVACFFVGKPRGVAEIILQGSGWNAYNAIQTLIDKCLIEREEVFSYTEERHVMRMHDQLRDLGREMAIKRSPHRLWRPRDLEPLESMGFKNIVAKTNVRCFHSIFDESMGFRVTFFLSPPDTLVETSGSVLWLQLEGDFTEPPGILSWIPLLNSGEQPSIPSCIPLQNLQYLKIKGGRLKTLWKNSGQAASQLKELQISKTSLKEFPDFAKEVCLDNRGKPSSVKGPMSGLEKLEISCEYLASKMFISGIHYPSLVSIKLHDMKNLMEVNLTGVKTLNCLDIENCLKLKRLTLREMECLESITSDINEPLKYMELDGCQNLKTIKLALNQLVEFSIRGCPKVVLPAFIGPCSIERIIIDGKFECLELNRCQNLRTVSGNLEVRRLYLCDCPQLQELSSLARQSCLEGIVIDFCGQTKGNISGIEELHASKYMRLSYCSNALIRNRIHKLKSVPSDYTLVIGRAVDGAESILNEDMFSDARIDFNPVIQIGTQEIYVTWSELNIAALIECFVVVVNSSVSIEDINESLKRYVYGYYYGYGYGYGYDYDYSINVREGEWIITMVAWDDWSYFNIMGIEYVLRKYGIVKKGFRVELKKDEGWKGVGVLCTIVDRLYHL